MEQADLTPLSRTLGWLSIRLGVAQLVAPRAVARTLGVEHRRMLLRALGVREIAYGVGILRNRQ